MRYWNKVLKVQALLLAIWFLVSYGLGILFVEPLNGFHMGGFPVGFWFSQQGSIYVFVILLFVYAKWMDRIDARFRVRSDRTEGAVGTDTETANPEAGD